MDKPAKNKNSEGVIVFTDGSSRGNPGPGGWGAVVISGQALGGRVDEYGGGEGSTTNNRMEMTALLEAVKRIDAPATIYSDSAYLINGFTKWIHDWKKNGWKSKAKEDVMNRDLWEALDESTKGKSIHLIRIHGHVGVAGNERCDEIATSFADGGRPSLYHGDLKDYPVRNVLEIADYNSTKKISKNNSKKAYSYVSAIDGVVMVHSTWDECESRVKGKSGAKYKKAVSKEDEDSIVRNFSVSL